MNRAHATRRSPPRFDSGSPRVREKRRRRQAEILRAALRAFGRKGYHRTTLDDIAEHVGVQKTALYHYFPDKEAILYECHRESLAELARIMREANRLGSATEMLTHAVHEHVRVMTDTLEGSPLAFEVTALSDERQARIIAGRDRYERQLRRIIHRGMRTGEFRKGDSKVAVFVLLGAINWIARWYRPDGALGASQLGEQFVDHLMRGMVTQ